MAQIEPAGLPALALEPLRELEVLPELSDERMVNICRRNLRDSKAPNPSVETLLHAFLPDKFIFHTHADAVLSIVNQENAPFLVKSIWGDKVALVPYIMPGFQLAKATLAVYRQHQPAEGLILRNHGIFTFGRTAREAYERMIELVDAAERYLNQTKNPLPAKASQCPNDALAVTCLPILRGCLMAHPASIGPVLLHLRTSNHLTIWLEQPNLSELATQGPITPDHIIRTKQKPLILVADPDPLQFRKQVQEALDAYTSEYEAYFNRQVQAKAINRQRIHPLPIVFLIQGLGLVTMGSSTQEAAIAADLYEHTVSTILQAEQVGRFAPLGESDLFDMEYWSLEQAKLGKQKALPLQGRIVLITGAAGGIGAATALYFGRLGAQLVLTDRHSEQLEALAHKLGSVDKVSVTHLVADVTHQKELEAVVDHAVLHFGGLDLVISNAGIAPSGPIHTSTDQLEASVRINLLSHQYLAAAATKLMLHQQVGGCLLFNASKSAFNPGPGFGRV